MPQDLPTLALSILNVSRNTLSIPDAVREMPTLQPLWNLACDMEVEGASTT